MDRSQKIIRTSIIGIVANVLLAAFKAAVGILASSVAIVMDAVNNLSDALSSVITIIGTKLSERPADREHPFGFGRVEYFSAIIIAVLVLSAGITSLIESVKKIFNPTEPEYTTVTLVVIVVAIVVKLVLGQYVKRQGQQLKSDALIASGSDALFDAIITLATLVSAGIMLLWNVSLDGILGALISIVITSVTTPKDCETMMQLNHLFFTSLRSDRDAFESWKVRQRAALANSESNPMSVLQDSVVKTIYTHDKLAGRLSSAELEQIDYNRVMQIARERFANAADFTFIVIGAIDEATILPLIERYIASLPSEKGHEMANMSALDYKKNKQQNTFRREMDVPMVSNEFFDYANIPFTLKNELSYSLALNALSVVLLEEIREKEGGTYSIGAYGDLMVNPAPRQQAIMEIFYQSSPDKYEYLNQRVRDIVANFVKEGPSEENMSKGKEFMLKNYKESLRENAYWLNAMKTLLYTNVDFISDYEKVLQSITKEDARSIIEQVMKQGNHSEIIMVGVER